MIVNNVGYNRSNYFINKTLNRIKYLFSHQLQGLRNSGSAAQNMSDVASGELNLYFEDGYGGPWDVVAGIVIINEAGGVCKDISGNEFVLKMGKGKIICGNEEIVNNVISILKKSDIYFYLNYFFSKAFNLATISAVFYFGFKYFSKK